MYCFCVDGLFGMAASGWISLHKTMESNIHKIQNKNTRSLNESVKTFLAYLKQLPLIQLTTTEFAVAFEVMNLVHTPVTCLLKIVHVHIFRILFTFTEGK